MLPEFLNVDLELESKESLDVIAAEILDLSKNGPNEDENPVFGKG